MIQSVQNALPRWRGFNLLYFSIEKAIFVSCLAVCKSPKTGGRNSARNVKTTLLLSLRGTKCRAPSYLRNVLQVALSVFHYTRR